MRVVNLATVSVDTTAGGTEIFSSTAARIATTEGMEAIVVNPSVDIVLVDSDGLYPSSSIPGAIAGTSANSPYTCPAGVPTIILHRSGPVRAISTSGTSTVKVGVSEAP
jgi:hypothetical protein